MTEMNILKFPTKRKNPMTALPVMTKELFRDLWRDDCMEEIEDHIDDSWRHGNYHDTVFERLNYVEETKDWVQTGEFYQAQYTVTGDGEEHGIRNGDFELFRVYPHETVVTKTVRTWELTPDG